MIHLRNIRAIPHLNKLKEKKIMIISADAQKDMTKFNMCLKSYFYEDQAIIRRKSSFISNEQYHYKSSSLVLVTVSDTM